MSQFSRFLTRCACGASTSRTYARANGGKCKACVTGVPREPHHREFKRKNGGRCEDAPCCGCCGPQGDGDFYGVAAMEVYPWMIIFPCLTLMLTLLALHFLGDGLREALDPKSGTT